MTNQPIAVVTGAYRGLGLETCRQLGARGYRVLLTARREDVGQAATDKLASDGHSVDFQELDVTNELSRVALRDRIKAQFGDRLSFHGAIDIQQTLPHGTRDEVRSEVRERCALLGRGGGYICTSAHYLQADTPLENIVVMYTTPRELDRA